MCARSVNAFHPYLYPKCIHRRTRVRGADASALRRRSVLVCECVHDTDADAGAVVSAPPSRCSMHRRRRVIAITPPTPSPCHCSLRCVPSFPRRHSLLAASINAASRHPMSSTCTPLRVAAVSVRDTGTCPRSCSRPAVVLWPCALNWVCACVYLLQFIAEQRVRRPDRRHHEHCRCDA